jgi:hypothetical protein
MGSGWLVVVLGAPVLRQWAGRRIPMCIFRELTGLPCPGCGSTRAGLAILRGDLLAALAFNPLMTLALLGVGLWLGVRFATGRLPSVAWPRWWPWLALPAGLAALAANWWYVIATQF